MKIVFMGTPDFAVPSLIKLIEKGYTIKGVVTQPDRPVGRKRVLQPPPVKEVAIQYGLPVFQPEKVKTPEAIETIASWTPDLIVTAAFGQILPLDLLRLPPFGAINVHASLLPKYRGGAPVQRAIMNGEKETGVTIMYMAEKLDSGDILSQVKLAIEETDDTGSLMKKLSEAGAKLLIDTLEKLKEGKIKGQPQKEEEATYAPLIRREDEVIHWDRPALAIFNQIRALSPHPGAYTTYKEQTIKVWRSVLTEERVSTAKEGTICRLDSDGIGVVCGDGKVLLLTEIQPSGKKRMPAAAFLRGAGQTWQVGERLG